MRWNKRVVMMMVSLVAANLVLLYLYNRYSVARYSDVLAAVLNMALRSSGNESDKQLNCLMKWYNYSDDGLNGEGIGMDDPRLVMKLRSKFLKPPPPRTASHHYFINQDVEDPSMGQSQMVRQYLKDKRNGVFIECGALDGETRSNTLYFERFLNWTGLLIEADPLNFIQMVEKNRVAWLSPTCLSIKPYPQIVAFEQNKNMGKIAVDEAKEDGSSNGGGGRKNLVDVQCFPLLTYLLALNTTRVDYFSLDVEGSELDVLKTIPFDRVHIDVLSVEFIHVEEGKDALKSFMESKGYRVLGTVTHPNWLANDYIFVKS